MKKLLVLFLFCAVHGYPQQNNKAYWPKDNEEIKSSGVILPGKLSAQQINNLSVLCRAWGFVKYFHPAVAGDSMVNADKALFAILPEVLSAENNKALDQLLFNWINILGDVPKKESKPLVPNVFREASFEWMKNDLLKDGKLKPQLNYILENRWRGESHYVRKMGTVGNPDFSTELTYKSFKGEDDAIRLLALFRYWNTVEYFYPSKYLTADNWDDVLKQFLPIFANSKTDVTYRMACFQLTATIHDTHAANIAGDPVIQKYLGTYSIPGIAGFVEGKMTMLYFYSDSLQKSCGLLPGDEIVAVNEKQFPQMIAAVSPYITASNESSFMNIAVNRLRRSYKIENEVTIVRDGKKMDVSVQYAPVSISTLKGMRVGPIYPMYKKLAEDIGYININKIRADSLPVIMKQFENTKGLVIDLRAYPSEFMPFALGSYLKPATSIFVRSTVVDFDLPGRFIKRRSGENGETNPDYYKGKIVILVNENSQSQAEYTVMALRTAPGAIVMGSQTSGADGNTSNVFFPGGLTSYISGLGIYCPDEKPTQGIGIVPDVFVKPTVKGIREGEDELLERALKYIKD
jgi:C-terminal processing protease CtpA/Prc